jgi:hypothetical protein
VDIDESDDLALQDLITLVLSGLRIHLVESI